MPDLQQRDRIRHASRYLRLAPEVTAAMDAGRAVVALESTVIAHGLPYPTNVEVALEMERAIREVGAVAATVAVLDGRIAIGLRPDEIERVGTEGGVRKASRRDLAPAIASGVTAATTVAGTLACAALAGIRFFATGGIGGVHRGAELTMDVSADLLELERSPVVTVCAGAKSILDLQRTLEYLETHSVPVVGYGTDELPAFYVRTSGLKVPHRADSPGEVAVIADVLWQSELGGGLLVTCPIPAEHALPAERVEAAINGALRAAEQDGVRGQAVTPYVLSRVAEATGGESVAANRALLLNNARLAAQFAVAYAELRVPRPRL